MTSDIIHGILLSKKGTFKVYMVKIPSLRQKFPTPGIGKVGQLINCVVVSEIFFSHIVSLWL